MRLILEPVMARALERLGRAALIDRLHAIVMDLRARGERTPGYAAGNILNVLLHLGADLRGTDFSGLCVWQVSLQAALLPHVRFIGADLSGATVAQPVQRLCDARFGADGQLHIAAVGRGRLRVWQSAEGQPREERVFATDATTASFGPDMRLIVSWHSDHNLRLWDAARGTLLHTLVDSVEAPWQLVLSPDDRTIGSSHGNGQLLVWDVVAGVLRHIQRDQTAAIAALAFSPDGGMLAGGDVDGRICLWRLESAELVRELSGHTDEVHVLVFDPVDGGTLVSGSHDRTLRVWDVASGQVRHTLRTHRDMIRAMAISADGRTLASGGADDFVCIWDMSTGTLRRTLPDIHQRSVFLSLDSNAQRLLIVGGDHSIDVWSITTGQRLEAVPTYHDPINALDVSPHGAQVIGGGTRGLPRIWQIGDAHAGQRVLAGHTDRVLAVGWSPSGDLVASAGCDRAIHLWHPGTGRLIRRLHGHDNDVEDLYFNRDGRRLLSCGRDMTVRLWDVETGELLQIFRSHTEAVLRCALRPDGRQAASGGLDKRIRLWDTENRSGSGPTQLLSGHMAAILSLAYSADGRYLLSSGFDQQVLVWDTDDGRLLYAFPDRKTITISIATHPGGELLATCDDDFTVRLWQFAPAGLHAGVLSAQPASHVVRLLSEMRGHTSGIEAVRFSPDGRRLYSASMDETIREWDVATGSCLRILRSEAPYAGMDITGTTGLNDEQRASLLALGAVDGP